MKPAIDTTGHVGVVIREQDPLKQGLKLDLTNREVLAAEEIREQDPLKQGLKRGSLTGMVSKV